MSQQQPVGLDAVGEAAVDGTNTRKLPVAFVVNGSPQSPMGERAAAFAKLLSGEYEIRIVHRGGSKLRSIWSIFAALAKLRPACVYVFDIGYSGILGASLYRGLFRRRMVVETGDAITELARSSGMRSGAGLYLTQLLENFALRYADSVVVRGSFHKQLLAQQGILSEMIPDGVDTREVRPAPGAGEMRRKLELEGVLTVGFVGSCVWSEKLGMCYGWELLEVLRLLKEEPVKGVIIGDGSGLPYLKERCREYGIEDKVLFLGRVPYNSLPEYLAAIDVCLSTQTNDIAGQVRTTGKLPIYLACGKYVLASRVGEAALLLDDNMLVHYNGTKDLEYPTRLAAQVQQVLLNPSLLAGSERRIALAQQHFDYSVLAPKVTAVIDTACGRERLDLYQ